MSDRRASGPQCRFAFDIAGMGPKHVSEVERRRCIRMSRGPQGEGQLHTLGLLEQFREESKGLWGASSKAYFRVDAMLRELANPNLHEFRRKCRSALNCGIVPISKFGG